MHKLFIASSILVKIVMKYGFKFKCIVDIFVKNISKFSSDGLEIKSVNISFKTSMMFEFRA